jgi:tRNA-specific 2-thiouridylase
VLVAMSGGVDSSVAAARAVEAGHDVTGVTLKLWGGESDSGCCSASDVADARRVADHLGIDHHVFNFGDDFERDVIGPYVQAHRDGRTPNPCVECNRHLKFDRLLTRAVALGFDRLATGHHARLVDTPDGPRLARGADAAKDQSYVLWMLDAAQLARLQFPVGDMNKDDVRAEAARLDLRTADKPDSQDVCFVASTVGRDGFLARRFAPTPGRVVDTAGNEIGAVDAVELVTVGQRRGLGTGGSGERRFAVDVDVATTTVTVGRREDLLCHRTPVEGFAWTGDEPRGRVTVQTSAHGTPVGAVVEGDSVVWGRPQRRVAPGQSVVVYDGDVVVGGGIAARPAS